MLQPLPLSRDVFLIGGADIYVGEDEVFAGADFGHEGEQGADGGDVEEVCVNGVGGGGCGGEVEVDEEVSDGV